MPDPSPTPNVVKITAETTFDLTKIKINGITHLCFVRSEVAGFQTWKTYAGVYTVELTMRGGAVIQTEYDDQDKWAKIIALIEERLTP